jgi:hypothetical protein
MSPDIRNKVCLYTNELEFGSVDSFGFLRKSKRDIEPCPGLGPKELDPLFDKSMA